MYYVKAKPRLNSRNYSRTIFQSEDEKEIASYISSRDLSYKVPFFFNKLMLNDDTIIICTTKITSQYIEVPTSPTKLLNILKEFNYRTFL